MYTYIRPNPQYDENEASRYILQITFILRIVTNSYITNFIERIIGLQVEICPYNEDSASLITRFIVIKKINYGIIYFVLFIFFLFENFKEKNQSLK